MNQISRHAITYVVLVLLGVVAPVARYAPWHDCCQHHGCSTQTSDARTEHSPHAGAGHHHGIACHGTHDRLATDCEETVPQSSAPQSSAAFAPVGGLFRTAGHDSDNCSICRYYAQGQWWTTVTPDGRTVPVEVFDSISASQPSLFISRAFLARGPPVA